METMAIESGVHPRYFSLLDARHDLLVEADVAAVTEVVATVPAMFEVDSFRIEHDVPAGSDAAQTSLVRVYRLAGHAWTQVFCPRIPRRSFELARLVSERLAGRCLQIEVTDDAWGGHVLYDRGEPKEISWLCVGQDLSLLGRRLDLAVADLDDEQLYEEIETFHSKLRSDGGSDPLEGLARLLGLWVDACTPVWESAPPLERLDLLFTS